MFTIRFYSRKRIIVLACIRSLPLLEKLKLSWIIIWSKKIMIFRVWCKTIINWIITQILIFLSIIIEKLLFQWWYLESWLLLALRIIWFSFFLNQISYIKKWQDNWLLLLLLSFNRWWYLTIVKSLKLLLLKLFWLIYWYYFPIVLIKIVLILLRSLLSVLRRLRLLILRI
jgi:hypothetical protein